MNNAPIGVFDSGLGGLTVWRELYRKLPHESLIYYGDGKNCPYGDKNREEVTAYVDLAVRRLIDRGVKLIVVACNAATAMAIDHLRRNYALPLVGLEPAVKPAAMASRSGVIGILATAATLNGRLFRETSQRYADRVKILTQVGEGFVELVESNREQTPEALARVDKLLRPMLDAGADQIVLGCTHYPFLSAAMRPGNRGTAGRPGESGGGDRTAGRGPAAAIRPAGGAGAYPAVRFYDQRRRNVPAAVDRQKRAGTDDGHRLKNAGASGADNKNLKTGCNYGS